MARMNTAEAVVASLVANGIDQVFGLPGVQNDVLFDALHGAQDRLRVIHTRHEQGAGYMALGAAMATGRPAVYTVVPGPGFLNSSAALSTAYACYAPVIALTGEVPQQQIGRGFGLLHEIPDQLGVMRSLTKWAARIRGPEEAGPLVEEAFRQLRSPPMRPVGLECPIDVWPQQGELVLADRATVDLPPIDEAEIAAAVKLLAAAERPLVAVGGGAQHAAAEVAALTELLQAPVAAGQMGFGVLDARHPLSVHQQLSYSLWRDTDVVVAIGTRLQVEQMYWGVPEGMKIIRIDADPSTLDRFQRPAVGIVGDAAAVLARLNAALAGQLPPRPNRTDELAALRSKFEADTEVLKPQRAYLGAIRQALPDDGILVDEITQLGHAARFLYPVYRPRTFISPGYQGTLGWGYATALGVKAARPEVPVVAMSGDGGFMFTMPEMATAMQHGLAVVAVVFDDGAYGNVRRSQEQRYGNRMIAWELKNPDFVALAGSFGMGAERVTSPAELTEAITEAIAADEPRLIHVPVGPMPDPWPHIFPHRA